MFNEEMYSVVVQARNPGSSLPPSPGKSLALLFKGACAQPPTSPGLASYRPAQQAEHTFKTSHWIANCLLSELNPWAHSSGWHMVDTQRQPDPNLSWVPSCSPCLGPPGTQ